MAQIRIRALNNEPDNSQKDTSHDTVAGEQGSLIGSTDGSVHMQAGNTLHVTGSDIIAAQDVTGVAANVTIDGSQTNRHHDETHESKTTGFSLTASAPVIDAAQNTLQQAGASGRSEDSRASALHAMAAASGAYDAVGAAGGAASDIASGKMPEAKLELSWGSSSSKSTLTEDRTNNTGSTVTVGGAAAFVATGGNVNIAGSDVNANNVILSASNQVNLTNSTDTDSTRSTNESKSAGVGVSVGTGGFGIDASMSKANGRANSDSTVQNNTHVNAANNVTIVSGSDTNVIGANVSGKSVTVDVGGDLNIASIQDTSTSRAHQDSTGGGLAISSSGASGSFNHSAGNASGDYRGVEEQSGIRAGTDGFDITVKGNTDLKGGVIASDATADKNTLTTGTLSFSDIQNNSSYDANSFGITAGGGVGSGGNNYATHGTTSVQNAGGVAPTFAHDSGSSSASTQSAIGQGTITITDAANQTQDIASLNRNTSNTNGTVSKLPDVNNLLDKQSDMMAATSAAGEAVARRIGDYADAQAKATGDPAWKEGGSARAEMQAAGAALVGGLGGGVGSAVGSATGAGLASMSAAKLNELSDSIASSSPTGNADMDRMLGNIVANVIATGAGAAVGGGAGATSAANVDRFNRQLHPDERQWAEKSAMDFASEYKEKTGRDLTPDQAQSMLLANGYRLVDAAASNGPGGDPIAVAYISKNAGSLFSATSAEYNSPFLYGNKDGSLTPEQLAMPGHEAHPQIGVAAGAGLDLVALSAVAPTVAAAWGLGTVYDFAGDAISHSMGLSPDTPNFTKSFTVGGVAGAMSPLLMPFTTLGTGIAGKAVMSGYNAAVGGVGAFGATAITNPGSSPDLSAGLGTAGVLFGFGAKTILPGSMANAFNTWMQILPGPAQAVMERNKNDK